MEQLAESFTVAEAELIRDVYAKPLFRGAGTTLPHSQQLTDEALFTTAVTRLFKLSTALQQLRKQQQLDAVNSSSDEDCAQPPSITTTAATTAEPSTNSAATDSSSAAASNQQIECSCSSSADIAAQMERSRSYLAGLYAQPEGEQLTQLFVALLQRCTAQQCELIAWVEYCSSLPEHASTREEAQTMVNAVGAFLRTIPSRPALITVARSVDDGYTPVCDAEWLLAAVLDMLNSVYGEVTVVTVPHN
jgi:hypothetical protein